MENNIEVLRRMYDSFNARDIDGVLAQLADDVTWANGRVARSISMRRAIANDIRLY